MLQEPLQLRWHRRGSFDARRAPEPGI